MSNKQSSNVLVKNILNKFNKFCGLLHCKHTILLLYIIMYIRGLEDILFVNDIKVKEKI